MPGLKKRIAQIARSKSEELLDENTVLPIVVESKDLEEILGAQKRHHQKVKDENPAGVVTGLAWTPVGGEVLFIETMSMPGNGATLITGQLGEVMQESAKIALSLLKSRLPIDFCRLRNAIFIFMFLQALRQRMVLLPELPYSVLWLL